MFTSTQTYSLAAVGARFMVGIACVRPWDQGRLHTDAKTGTDFITLAGRSLR